MNLMDKFFVSYNCIIPISSKVITSILIFFSSFVEKMIETGILFLSLKSIKMRFAKEKQLSSEVDSVA